MKNQTRRKSSDTGSRRRSDNDYSGGSSGHSRRSSVYDNRGSNFDDGDGRFNQNYGYGSQQNNEDYRDFSSQGRNSGLGNQGGYSTYGQDKDHRYDESYGSQYHNYYGKGGRTSRYDSDFEDDQDDRPYGNGFSNSDNTYGENSQRREGNAPSKQWGTYSNGDNEGRDWESNRGKGPKGYTRSDERIQEDVNDILSEDHHLDASQIEVSVEKGEVTLSGTVASRQDKRHAEDIIEHVSGVKNVENRIKISSSSSLKKNKDSESTTSKASETPASKTKQTNGIHV